MNWASIKLSEYFEDTEKGRLWTHPITLVLGDKMRHLCHFATVRDKKGWITLVDDPGVLRWCG